MFRGDFDVEKDHCDLVSVFSLVKDGCMEVLSFTTPPRPLQCGIPYGFVYSRMLWSKPSRRIHFYPLASYDCVLFFLFQYLWLSNFATTNLRSIMTSLPRLCGRIICWTTVHKWRWTCILCGRLIKVSRLDLSLTSPQQSPSTTITWPVLLLVWHLWGNLKLCCK